jgi:hypothetical protein
MADDFSSRYGDLLTGWYDCVDRIVLTHSSRWAITRAGSASGGGAGMTAPTTSWTTPT